MSLRIISLFTACALAAGCATDEFGNPRPLTDTQKGVLIGVASGAGIGYLANKDRHAKGALIGAVGGGIAGGLVGNYMDKQKSDLEKVLAPQVQQGAVTIDKLPEHALLVTMTAQTAFDFDSSNVKPAFYPAMDRIADVFVRYGKTHLTVIGYTDNIGSAQYNQSLSERRARAVQSYLENKGVVAQRLVSEGKGESAPRASNANEEGRRLNRRVEIVIEPVVEG